MKMEKKHWQAITALAYFLLAILIVMAICKKADAQTSDGCHRAEMAMEEGKATRQQVSIACQNANNPCQVAINAEDAGFGDPTEIELYCNPDKTPKAGTEWYPKDGPTASLPAPVTEDVPKPAINLNADDSSATEGFTFRTTLRILLGIALSVFALWGLNIVIGHRQRPI